MFSGVEISEANGRTAKTFLTASGKNTSGITDPEVSCTIALFTCHKPNIFVVTNPSSLNITLHDILIIKENDRDTKNRNRFSSVGSC